MSTKRVLYALAIIALLMLAGYSFWRRPPKSLVEAARLYPEVFPSGYRVVLPLSAASRLGQREADSPAGASKAEYVVTSDVPCFFISPTAKDSLTEISVRYSDQRSFALEAKQVAQSAGLTLSDEASAEMVLKNLRVETAIGWPNLNGPCVFDAETSEHRVITSQVVADTVEFKMSGAAGASGTGSVAQAEASVSTTGTWKSTTARSASGRQVVISAAFSTVRVATTSVSLGLGGTPQIGRSFDFPAGFDGNLVLEDFDAGTRRVRFQVSVPANASQAAPSGLETCSPGKTLELEVGRRCSFWLPPGNALLAVSWEIDSSAAAPQLVLRMRGYKTTFPLSGTKQ